jgi:hypothetical protein
MLLSTISTQIHTKNILNLKINSTRFSFMVLRDFSLQNGHNIDSEVNYEWKKERERKYNKYNNYINFLHNDISPHQAMEHIYKHLHLRIEHWQLEQSSAPYITLH